MNLSQPWVNDLFKALKPKKGYKLKTFECRDSHAAVITFEPPPFIAVEEKGSGQENYIFWFETYTYRGPTIFHCDLVKYPELADLVAKHSPTKHYEIRPIIRKSRRGKPAEFAGSKLAALIYGD